MRETKHRNRSVALALAFGAAAVATAVPVSRAQAAEPDAAHDRGPERNGAQLEGMIGGAGCIPGRAPCRYETDPFTGRTRPSLGTGVTLGWRAARWLMLGGYYRLGMFRPIYDGPDPSYRYAAQHTVGVVLRPILPIWRFDLGLDIAPGYSRQVFRYDGSRDRDWSQGFAMMVGPTIDVFITDRFFLGAEVDFIFNTQRRVCQQRGDTELCANNVSRQVAPTHQSLFGLHLGGTFR
jgi:hypothetical protein